MYRYVFIDISTKHKEDEDADESRTMNIPTRSSQRYLEAELTIHSRFGYVAPYNPKTPR
jgi:hypothetical protein